MRHFIQLLHLFSLSGVAYGQRTPVKPVAEQNYYRLYAGAATVVYSYQTVSLVNSIRYINTNAIYPLSLYVGYQPTPRLAAQIEFCQHKPAAGNYQRNGHLPDGRVYETYDRRKQYDGALLTLLRYRITRNLKQKFHIDGLTGITTQFHRYRQEVSTSIDGQVINYELQDERSTNHYITTGLSVGIMMRHKFDATAGAGINTNTETLRFAGFRTITPALNVGIRYFFSLRTPSQD